MEENRGIKDGLWMVGYAAIAAVMIPITALAGLAFFGGIKAKEHVYDLPRKNPL